jgi:serine/threonine-protein kinase
VSPRETELIGAKYRLVRPLQTGGMGSVWVALHEDLAVEVAVKFCRDGATLDDRSEQRFRREAQAAAKLSSPHVVQIHDYGVHQGTPYIVMERLRGEDLGELLERKGRVRPHHTLELLRQAAKALSLAHSAGVVHRDIKPANLFLARVGEDTVLKVLDFGIAKHVETDKNAASSETITAAGTILGSPPYMSPEQARGAPLDHRTDLWSLTAVLYRMLTGEPAFRGQTSHDTIIRVCTETPRAPSELDPSLPSALDAFFARGFERDVARRFQSVEEIVQTFEAAVAGSPIAAPEPSVERASIARSSATESLVMAAPAEPRTRTRWVRFAAGALTAVGLGVVLLTGRTTTDSERNARTSGTFDAPTNPAPAAHPVSTDSLEDARPHAEGSTAPAAAGTAAAFGSAPAGSASTHEKPRSAKLKPAEPAPALAPATDPIFGLPVSHEPAAGERARETNTRTPR